MRVRLDYTGIMTDTVGEEHGIDPNDLGHMADTADIAHKALIDRRDAGELGFMELPRKHLFLDTVRDLAAELKQDFESFVVIGIGGSALGAIALQSALNPPFYNELPAEKRSGGLKIYVPDNVDPVLIRGLLDVIDLSKTVFNVITKSGGTAETMANFLVVRQALINAVGKDRYPRHIVATTDPERGLLRKLAREEGFRTLDVPPNVGGRFSVLTPVGLLAAAAANIDIEELLAGAAYMDSLCDDSDIYTNPAYMNAVLQYLMYRKGKHISVVMPYVQGLRDIADWYRQLWAESLGKKQTRDGMLVNTGPTPAKALGATDQHSQAQLYIEGPCDKVITFIAVDTYAREVVVPQAYPEEDGVNYLGGRTLNELITAEFRATAYALTENNRPNCTVVLPEVNPFTVGQLLYMFELQTAFAGELFNINAFDQPGVEHGKKATYALMGRKGFESLRDQLSGSQSIESRKII